MITKINTYQYLLGLEILDEYKHDLTMDLNEICLKVMHVAYLLIATLYNIVKTGFQRNYKRCTS